MTRRKALSAPTRDLHVIAERVAQRLSRLGIPNLEPMTVVYHPAARQMIDHAVKRGSDPIANGAGRKLRASFRRHLKRGHLNQLPREELVRIISGIQLQPHRLPADLLAELIARHMTYEVVDTIMHRGRRAPSPAEAFEAAEAVGL